MGMSVVGSCCAASVRSGVKHDVRKSLSQLEPFKQFCPKCIAFK